MGIGAAGGLWASGGWRAKTVATPCTGRFAVAPLCCSSKYCILFYLGARCFLQDTIWLLGLINWLKAEILTVLVKSKNWCNLISSPSASSRFGTLPNRFLVSENLGIPKISGRRWSLLD